MNTWRLQSSTGRVLFKAYLASDHLTPATGKTIAVTLSKNGGAFGNPNAGASNATEIANGWYYFAPAAQDRDTQGPLVWRGTEGTIDPAETEELVVDAVRAGLTALPNAAADAAGGLPISDAGGLDLDAQRTDVAAILVDTGTTLDGRIPAALVGGRMDSHIGSIADAVLTAAKFAAGAFDAVWSVAARLLTAGTNIVLAKGTGITGFNDIPAGTAMTLTAGERTAVANEVEAQIIDETDSEKVLTAITDKIAATNPSLAGLTLAAIASAVRTELAIELGRVDVAVSSRATSAQATAIEADTQDLQGRLPAALVGGRIAAIAEVVGDKTAYELTAGERTAIVAALFATAAEGPETYIQTLRIMRAALAGISSGHAAGAPVYRDRADAKNRIAATTDADGNRTAVTTDGA